MKVFCYLVFSDLKHQADTSKEAIFTGVETYLLKARSNKVDDAHQRGPLQPSVFVIKEPINIWWVDSLFVNDGC